MTPRKKIFFNIVATYGRSLYALFLGVFTARWALNALGQVDYGLAGVVGGLVGFVAFLNGLLSFSVSRFYAVNVGAEIKSCDKSAAIEECRKWFNTALLIHTVVPILLLVIGYPLGEWAVRCFLTIPRERIYDCVWVWRFTCCSCFIGMVSVPFNAMYGAKQDIAELTIYSFITSTLNAFFLYYMITHPRVWLLRYSLWCCLISIIPSIIQMVRSFIKYPECRFNHKYLYDKYRLKEITVFGLARFWTMFSNIISGQGNAILVNKYLGPESNASMSLGRTVVAHASTLSGALTGAFSPAIMNAAGEGDPEKVRRLSYQLCRIGTLLMLIFAIPLGLEIEEVLILWLKTPPPFVAELVIAVLIDSILERMTEGLYMPIIAFGKGMTRYSWWAGWCGMSRFAIAWLLLYLGMGMYGICASLIAARVIVVLMRLYMGCKLSGMSPSYWIKKVLFPIGVAAVVTATTGMLTRPMSPSFLRVLLTTLVCEITLLPISWFLILSDFERAMVLKRVSLLLEKIKVSR